ncbi:helix-turn-helix domain-containing protein [Actinomadura nitritigenes]|uniref:AraC-like ligand-binding domain-containing protein n=1 Tax=Actinomadura nitritigenes TaxID=134602 RepID=UPI003D8C60DF
MQMIFNGDDWSPGDRLTALDEIFINSSHPMRLASDFPQEFQASMRALDLGAVNVVELTASPSEVLRTPRFIRQSDPELCSVIFPLQGQLVLNQAHREVILNPGDYALYDSSRAFRLRIATGSERATLVRAHMPRALLSLPTDAIRRLSAVPLCGRTGVGSLLVQYLTTLTTGAADYRPADLSRLGTITHDLLAAALAHHLEADTATQSSSRHGLLLRIEAFIQQHLRDPSLSPETVAHAHHISLSHLHRLFSTRNTTVAAWIRQQRLERARRDLGNPAMQAIPVHRIATHWGFRDHPTFTRAFRAVYGTPPKDYREKAWRSAA